MRLYVYGVTTREASVPSGLNGVGMPPAAVRLVTVGPVAAVVGEAPALVRARRRDVIAHQDVLAEVGRSAPVLPACFGMVAEDERALRATLERETEANLAALERVRGRVEMNLKIAVAESGLPDLVRESAKIRRLHEQAGRDSDYTARVQLGEAIATGLRQRAEAVAQEAVRRVSEVAEEAVPGPEADGYVANISFLVAAEQVDAVREAVAELAAESESRALLRLTGPLPCYSFCSRPAARAAVKV